MGNAEQSLLYWQSRSRGFLYDLRKVDVGCSSASTVLARFDQSLYSDDLFAELGVDRPARLESAVVKRRSEFLAGRMVANAALSAHGYGPSTIPIGSNREPIWPSNIVGSISHSNGRCAAIVTDQPGNLVGIDIEDIAGASALNSIFQVILLPDEAHFIRDQNAFPVDVLATLLFSAVEKRAKLTP